MYLNISEVKQDFHVVIIWKHYTEKENSINVEVDLFSNYICTHLYHPNGPIKSKNFMRVGLLHLDCISSTIHEDRRNRMIQDEDAKP